MNDVQYRHRVTQWRIWMGTQAKCVVRLDPIWVCLTTVLCRFRAYDQALLLSNKALLKTIIHVLTFHIPLASMIFIVASFF